MILQTVRDAQVGDRINTVIEILQCYGNHVLGKEVLTGVHVAFDHEGVRSDSHWTLYKAIKASSEVNDVCNLELDPDYPPLPSRPAIPSDVMFAMDLCCGIGGFCTALHFMNHHVIAAVDSNDLAMSASALNHDVPMLCADLLGIDTVYWLHGQQIKHGCQALITCGYPCQPLSKQGRQQGSADPRSRTLHGVLEASFLLQSCGLLLECVPEAISDGATQRALKEHSLLRGFVLHQKILNLHDSWPSRRSRCFSLLLPAEWRVDIFPELPLIQPKPVVGNLISSGMWPVWDQSEERQLTWTTDEMHAFRNPTFGSTQREVDLNQPLQTALHSWGSPLSKCPCNCRDAGFSLRALMSQGLRGVEIKSALWPHESRHIHPKELQLLLGFPPLQRVLGDCRAQLCLFGNTVSPVQCIWILAHVQASLRTDDFMPPPRECLSEYMRQLLAQRDVTWPSPQPGVGTLKLLLPDKEIQAHFDSLQTAGQLCRAEAVLQQDTTLLQLRCDGITLPHWAYLQAKTYEVVGTIECQDLPLQPVTLAVEYLGVSKIFVVPSTFSYRNLLAWLGIDEFLHLTDETGTFLDLQAEVESWKVVTVQSDPDSLLFAAGFQELGFGSPDVSAGPLKTSAPWICTGLWRQDQLAHTSLFLSWFGLDFASVIVWLPSFADAIVEKWPCFTSDALRDWLQEPDTVIYVLLFETNGWNLLKLDFNSHCTTVKYFEKAGCVSPAAIYLAHRAHEVSGRSIFVEQNSGTTVEDTDRSLSLILSLLDLDLGFSPLVASIFKQIRQTFDSANDLDLLAKLGASCSTTLPWSDFGAQMPITSNSRKENDSVRHGIAARFILKFAQALVSSHPVQVMPQQIKVLLLDSEVPSGLDWTHCVFGHSPEPLFLFVLAQGHWTFVHCYKENSSIFLTQFDGLQSAGIEHLGKIGQALKQAWRAEHIQIHTTWKVPQTRSDSCGTIALAHCALLLGLISYEQATHFETMHSGFAILSSLMLRPGPFGRGPEDQAVTQQLTSLLPEKGVPQEELPARIKAALKLFGASAIGQALEAKNPWTALKQLGNSKPKPFFWVTHSELQQHIKDKAQQQHGVALDQKKNKKNKDAKPRIPAVQQLDPGSLKLPPGVLITCTGEPLPQIPLTAVQKDAKGVAFASAQDAAPYLADGKLITPEALTLLIIGLLPQDLPQSLPMHAMQVPAVYRGTDEPILVDCISVQLGDQAVYRKINQAAPKIASYPTEVLRVHVFKDQWGTHADWEEFVAHPVKALVSLFPILRICRTEGCILCSSGLGSCGTTRVLAF